jgi:hypothetical protein
MDYQEEAWELEVIVAHLGSATSRWHDVGIFIQRLHARQREAGLWRCQTNSPATTLAGRPHGGKPAYDGFQNEKAVRENQDSSQLADMEKLMDECEQCVKQRDPQCAPLAVLLFNIHFCDR